MLAADHIAVSTPVDYYNIPASLKSYIDPIVRGQAVHGAHGLGRVYTEGSPIRDRDIATAYLRLILRVIGIETVLFVAAGGAKAVAMREVPRADFLRTFRPAITAAAQA